MSPTDVDKARVYIGLGSNLEDPRAQLQRALRSLQAHPEIELGAVSAGYRSAPMGPPDQPDYLNAVARLDTRLEPQGLLDVLQAIEAGQGRVRDGRRWGARTLDLDILLYADRCLADARLTIPHPGLAERNFVLYPLADIAPDLVIPGLGPVADLLASCPATGLERLPDALRF